MSNWIDASWQRNLPMTKEVWVFANFIVTGKPDWHTLLRPTIEAMMISGAMAIAHFVSK